MDVECCLSSLAIWKMKKQFHLFTSLLLATIFASTAVSAAGTSDVAAKFKKQMDVIGRAQRALADRMNEVDSDIQREKILMTKPMDKVYGDLLALVKANPAEPAAARADFFLMTDPLVEPVMRAKAIQIARQRYVNNPGIARPAVILGVHYDEEFAPGCENLLRTLKTSSSKLVRGASAFGLANLLKAKKKEAEAVALYKDVIKNYSDVVIPGDDKYLTITAREELYKLQFLSEGKKAPEISGITWDNKKIKLSDFRGKVVLLSFFGDW